MTTDRMPTAAEIDAELSAIEAARGITYRPGELQTQSGERGPRPQGGSGNGHGTAQAQDAVKLMTDKQEACLRREIPRRQTSHLALGHLAIVDGIRVRLEDGRPIKRQTASQALDMLFAAPFLPRPVAPQPEVKPTAQVPDGRYAIRDRDDETHVRFFRVNTPTQGRWAGSTFVAAQASDELHNIRNSTQREAILAQIAEDIEGALRLYGTEIGRCGHCNRTLTDDDSRAFGIGPICRGKLGL